MKKTILTIIFAAGLLFSATPAMAATNFSFSPVTVNVTAGNDFNVLVVSNPNGVANYTTKLVVNFPADLLEVKSFAFGDAWMPLAQSGYNLIDNTNGVLIKTGGYPATGYSSSVAFGTISFHTKKAGTGVIKTGAGMVSYDGENNNVIGTGSSQVSLIISAVPVKKAPTTVTTPQKPATTVTPAQPEKEAEVEPAPEEQPEITEEVPEVTIPVEQPSSFQASFLSALGDILKTNIRLSCSLLLLLLAFILGYLTRLYIEKSRKEGE